MWNWASLRTEDPYVELALGLGTSVRNWAPSRLGTHGWCWYPLRARDPMWNWVFLEARDPLWNWASLRDYLWLCC